MLRDYQTKAVKDVYSSLSKNRSCILQLPTGSGKTHVAMEIISHGLRHGRRINFMVDRITLLDQTLDKFFEAGFPVGVMQSSHPMANPSKEVQIISIQTLKRRDRSYWPHGDLNIVDECHDQHQVTYEMMDHWDNLKYLGLSATPFTRGLGQHWEDLVVGTTTRELIQQGHLADYDAYGPSTPDLRGVRQHGGDYAPRAVAERMNAITGDIVTHYQSFAAGKKAIAFTPTVDYAKALAEEFQRAGVEADYVCGYDNEERRDQVMSDYRDGRLQVLCNCEVLTKGYDSPDTEVGILARPTRSLSLHIQMMGRILRTHPSKDKALFLDHAGNIARLGFPDDELPSILDEGERGVNSDTRQKDEPEPWNCPKCHSMVPPSTGQCPCCGFKPERKKVEVQAGVLQKLDRPDFTGKQLKQDVYSQLLDIAHARKYSTGWVSHKYRELFEVWPKGLVPVRKQASEDMKRWITSRNIAWAHRKENV